MMAYGGFVGGIAGAALYVRRSQLDALRYFDAAVPAVGLGYFLARIGCFLNGCDFGAPSNLPWSVQFPMDSAAFHFQRAAGLLGPEATESLSVHPVQLYLGLAGLAAAFIAAQWGHRPQTAPGQTFCLYWLLYGCSRFALEFLRADPHRGSVGLLSLPQAISIAVITVAATTFALLHYRTYRHTAISARGVPGKSVQARCEAQG